MLINSGWGERDTLTGRQNMEREGKSFKRLNAMSGLLICDREDGESGSFGKKIN